MSIVVATDFSPCSRAAIRLATAQARRRGVPLLLVNVVEPPSIDLFATPAFSADWERYLVDAAERMIARDANEIRENGAAVESRVLFGFAATTILDVARELRAELIVVGTHGRKGGAHLLLGSVAERVVRASTCPVLVTGDHPTAVDHWDGRAPLQLTIALDGSRASQAALAWAGDFAKTQRCDLSLVRVYSPAEEALRQGLEDPWEGPPRDQELLPVLERNLQRDAETSIGHVPAHRFRAARRAVPEVLAEEAATSRADALVVGVPRHHQLGGAGIAPGPVLRYAPLPVLCIPEALAPAHPQSSRIGTVLIASDLSDASRQAIAPAYALLRATGGRAELCYVHVVGAPDAIAAVPLAAPLDADRRKEIEAQLRAAIPPDAEASGIVTGLSVVEGRFAAESIIAAAERLGADVIVVGSHGRSGLGRVLLGSVAEEVARHSPRPVLIVRAR